MSPWKGIQGPVWEEGQARMLHTSLDEAYLQRHPLLLA